MVRPVALAALLAVAGPAALPAAAQPAPRLPSLTPGVFESRGTAPRVSLPDIERQPLSGFGPPPRSWVVPADREPVAEPFAPDPDGLPELALAPPPAPPSGLPAVRTLRAEGGGGTPYARYGRLNATLGGEAARFYVDAAYDGLDRRSQTAFVAHDLYRVAAGGQSYAAGRLRLDAHAASDVYGLFGAEQRRRLTWGSAFGSEGVGRVPFRVHVGYEQTRLRSSTGAVPETTEGRLDVAARVAPGVLRLDAAGGVAGAGATLGTDLRYGAVGAAVALARPATGARATLGVRAMGYDATSSAEAQAVGPVVDVLLPVGTGGLRVFVLNDPRVAVRSLASLAEMNPFVTPGVVVAPDVFVADARAGVELERAAVRLRVFGTGLYAPTYLTLTPASVGGGFAEVYVDARSVGVGADASVGRPDGVSATAAVEVRRGRSSDGLDLALFAPVLGQAGVQAPFAGGRGRAGLALYAEAARPDGLGGTASAWGRLSVDASYEVAGPLAAVLRADRLLGSAERWPGYPEAPYNVLLGVRLTR